MRADRLLARATILRTLRSWMDARGYREVNTPVIVPSPALEEYLEPVQVGAAYLHTSPEFAMKRVLASGLCRIYQVVPCFREEEVGVHHAREFTMVEWYRVGAGIFELMDEVESLFDACARAVAVEVGPFTRVPVSTLLDPDLEPDVWFRQWVDAVEPTLTGPTIVWGYPPWQAALARIRGPIADRFEVYAGGIELANAFAEELDGSEIRSRLERANAARKAAGRRPHPEDTSFLAAVSRMPRTAGIALGLDRFVMALTGARSIAEVQVESGPP
jgi:elongation factor P--(R)-beta-lysine ligase